MITVNEARELTNNKNDIEIIKMDKLDLGAMVTFYCNNSKVLDEIFADDEELF